MQQNVSDNQISEIDLNQLTQKIGRGFNNLGTVIFDIIQFFIKHAIALILLVILGLAAGFYLNSVQKKYDHKIIVTPNFNSVEYLYNKINLLNIKIKDNDTVFLKELGIKYPKKLRKIEIEAILDPFSFVKHSETNLEMLKLIAEDGSMEKVLKSDMASIRNEFHQISFTTKDVITQENMIDPLLNYLNDNDYLKKVQQKFIANINDKIVYSQQTLNQVNGILDNFSNAGKNQPSDSKLMYYNNENNQINDILHTKNNLVNEIGSYKIELINTEKIIKDISIIPNIQRETSIPVLLPLLFVSLYIFTVFFIAFYKRQQQIKRSKA